MNTPFSLASDEQVHQELCRRLRLARIAAEMTQEELAQASGVSKKTISRAERNLMSLSLATLIPILRALGMIEQLDSFLPPPPPSPLKQRPQETQTRQRVRKPKAEHLAKQDKQGWKWGDEQ